MQDTINEAMFEFAMVVQSLIKNGWEFKKIHYGERRLGIGPRIDLQRGEVIENAYCVSDLERLIERG